MYVHYKENEKDQFILDDILATLRDSLEAWFGRGARLATTSPDIRSYRNSFLLRYPVTTSTADERHILVKIRRSPKMDSLLQAIQADIHENMGAEYEALKYFYEQFSHVQKDFGAIRPLDYLERYHAIVMEEFPSRTLRHLLVDLRSSKPGWETSDLKDAARKTGRWLHYFHHRLNTPFEENYTTGNILNEVREYAESIESYSQGRVRAGSILDAFSKRLENIPIKHVTFSQTHSDMTTDNVLYSDNGKVCIIDIKNRPGPIYVDLGLILTHPETSKLQIFSAGTYYPENLLCRYRTEIIAGYFDDMPGNRTLIQIYSAIMVLNKWLMYEELMNRYKGIKHLLAIPAAPLVSAYFQSLLRKHLRLIGDS